MFDEQVEPRAPRTLDRAVFAIVDVETTGLDPAADRVVEVACAVVRGGRRIDAFSSLVNPGRSIPATASAVHHITDRDVRDAPPLEALRSKLVSLCAGAVVVAHNARFDLSFLPFLAVRPVMCSMRLASRVVPEAPNFKNQVLRYHLGIEPAGECAPHRAGGDVEVTRHILDACLKRYLASGGSDDVDALMREIAAPRRLPAFPFGRHRGTPLSDVPADYLQWLASESNSASLDARYSAACELERRGAAARSPRRGVSAGGITRRSAPAVAGATYGANADQPA